MRNKVWIIVSLTVIMISSSQSARAGWLDKINQAAQNLNQPAKPAQQQPTDADHPIQLQGQGHCKGQNSATCMDYMEVVDQCMAPLYGYHAKLFADRIE